MAKAAASDLIGKNAGQSRVRRQPWDFPGIDLSRLAAALGKPAPALRDVPLPGHDHLIATRNHNRPEWWPVYVIGVTDPASFARIERAKDLGTALRLAADPRNGVTKPIPTNVFPWFQTLPVTLRHR